MNTDVKGILLTDENVKNKKEERRSNDLELLQEANKKLSTLPIKGKEYIPVNERIKAFREIYPRGQILTEIISLDAGTVTFKASIYDDENKLLAVGHAQEKEGTSFINKTSYIENCETSALGRALGFCGIGLDNGVASYEEVANAKIQQNDPVTIDKKQWEELKLMYSKDQIKQFQKELGITKGMDITIDFFQQKKNEYWAKVQAEKPDQDYF